MGVEFLLSLIDGDEIAWVWTHSKQRKGKMKFGKVLYSLFRQIKMKSAMRESERSKFRTTCWWSWGAFRGARGRLLRSGRGDRHGRGWCWGRRRDVWYGRGRIRDDFSPSARSLQFYSSWLRRSPPRHMATSPTLIECIVLTSNHRWRRQRTEKQRIYCIYCVY